MITLSELITHWFNNVLLHEHFLCRSVTYLDNIQTLL